ncbi:virulence RhuM family protein [Patescibacteria group bacterium]|nr:virulence RhuM family protein [Patescibacteria group bacterium]
MFPQNNSQLIIYQTESGETKIDVRLDKETVWLTQKLMAKLFDTSVPNINMHLKNCFNEGELSKKATIKKFLTVQKEGNRKVSRKGVYYNLDAIISVGYRIKSKTATHFRIWATKRLKEYIIKGFVLDDERLKNPDLPFDYFEELTQRIQDIRTSEKRFYRKITDIYALSVDYDPTDPMSVEFFQTVQNKVHFAITGKTAAEIISERVDSKKPYMGLTNWRGEKVRKVDTLIAKNYLNKKELLTLNNLVEQYLVFAEGQAMQRIPMRMKDWIEKLEGFLTLNNREILQKKGKISHKEGKRLAEKNYKEYNKKRINKHDQIDTTFDSAVKLIESQKKEESSE